jgi:toxin ParE1/3/4
VRKRIWPVDLGELAEQDYDNILLWTAETFGARQAMAYGRLIEMAFGALMRDPLAPPSRSRNDDVGPGLRTLHLARPGRHLLLYSIGDERVRVLRILHDSMEISRHLSPDD